MKKILSLIATATITVLMISGCSEEKKAEVDGLPYVKLNLVINAPGGSKNDEELVEAKINEYLMEKLNCEINLMLTPSGTYAQTTPLKLQASEQMDLIWSNQEAMAQNIANDMYLELDELYEKYGQGIKSVVDPILIEGSKVNGKMYAIPVNKEIAGSTGIVYVKKYVDKYNFDVENVHFMPQLTPILQIMHDSEPSVEPITIPPGVGTPLPYSDESTRYEVVGGVKSVVYDRQTKRFVNPYETQLSYETYKLLEEWNKKGFIAKDSASGDTMDNMIKAGTAWITFGTGKPGFAHQLARSTGVEIVTGSVGTPVISSESLRGSVTVIPFTSIDPARAMMVLDLLYTDAYLLNLLINGIEGKHFIKYDGNRMKLPDGYTTSIDTGYAPFIDWVIGNQFINYLWDFEVADKWEQFKEYNARAVTAETTGFMFDTNAVRTELAAISNTLSEYTPSFDRGMITVDEELPKMNNKIANLGNDRIIAEVTKQYDEFLKAKQ